MRARRDAAQAHREGMARELAEREAHLEVRLQQARSEAAGVAAAQLQAAAQAQQKLEGHLAVLRATAADGQVTFVVPLADMMQGPMLKAFLPVANPSVPISL